MHLHDEGPVVSKIRGKAIVERVDTWRLVLCESGSGQEANGNDYQDVSRHLNCNAPASVSVFALCAFDKRKTGSSVCSPFKTRRAFLS